MEKNKKKKEKKDNYSNLFPAARTNWNFVYMEGSTKEEYIEVIKNKGIPST